MRKVGIFGLCGVAILAVYILNRLLEKQSDTAKEENEGEASSTPVRGALDGYNWDNILPAGFEEDNNVKELSKDDALKIVCSLLDLKGVLCRALYEARFCDLTPDVSGEVFGIPRLKLRDILSEAGFDVSASKGTLKLHIGCHDLLFPTEDNGDYVPVNFLESMLNGTVSGSIGNIECLYCTQAKLDKVSSYDKDSYSRLSSYLSGVSTRLLVGDGLLEVPIWWLECILSINAEQGWHILRIASNKLAVVYRDRANNTVTWCTKYVIPYNKDTDMVSVKNLKLL